MTLLLEIINTILLIGLIGLYLRSRDLESRLEDLEDYVGLEDGPEYDPDPPAIPEYRVIDLSAVRRDRKAA